MIIFSSACMSICVRVRILLLLLQLFKKARHSDGFDFLKIDPSVEAFGFLHFKVYFAEVY